VTSLDESARNAIERDCTRLVLASIRAFDERDFRSYAELFAPDGVFVRANLPQEPLNGRAEILAALAARPASRITRHLCTNIEIEAIDARHARGRCYLLLYAADVAVPESALGRRAESPQRIGEYHDEFVQIGADWRIARRVGRLIFHADGAR
jgi:hypothetical protein